MERLRDEMSFKYLQYGLNKETLELSQQLDVQIAQEQRKRLEEYIKNKKGN